MRCFIKSFSYDNYNIFKMQASDGDIYEGLITYENGDRYTGEWKDNKREGNGMITYANGDEYFGEWILDNKEGRGVMRYMNGNVYDGEWRMERKC